MVGRDGARGDGGARRRLCSPDRHAREQRLSQERRPQLAIQVLARDLGHARGDPGRRFRGLTQEKARMDKIFAGGAGAPIPHDSAHLHVSGEALYTDDIAEVRGTVHAAIGLSERAHARIKSIDLTKVLAAPGVVAVLTAKDVPGKNDYGPVIADDPIFATMLVQYVGQSI